MSKLYEYVTSKHSIEDAPHGWLQWKGSDVCIDIHCVCGHSAHLDSDFLYNYKCRKCSRIYAMSPFITMVELPEDIAEEAERDACVQTEKE